MVQRRWGNIPRKGSTVWRLPVTTVARYGREGDMRPQAAAQPGDVVRRDGRSK
ncbi:hypothetical protein SESBI_40764 [Sesbania bispinosa]|nr:hypothetical protein SESBI_40764 [Sesbania bispinosa]